MAAMPLSTEVQRADRNTFNPLATHFEERYFTKKKASRHGHPFSKKTELSAHNMNQNHMLAFVNLKRSVRPNEPCPVSTFSAAIHSVHAAIKYANAEKVLGERPHMLIYHLSVINGR